MNDLLNKKCVACEEKGIKPFTKEETGKFLTKVPDWVLDEHHKKISKEFKFKDFIGAINFVERVADVAEMEGHHPDIEIHYNKVKLTNWTHAIGGLSENDFILAAKIDAQNGF